MNECGEKVKLKRGRKSKAELMKILEEKQNQENVDGENNEMKDNQIKNKKEKKTGSKKKDMNKPDEILNNHTSTTHVYESVPQNIVLVNSMNDIVNDNMNDTAENNATVPPIGKKRGRKPKGGKIIQQDAPLVKEKAENPNIILHLKCYLKDLNPIESENENSVESFHFPVSKNELSYDVIYKAEIIENEIFQKNCHEHIQEDSFTESQPNEIKNHNREIWQKLKILEKSLHLNDLTDKKSACFWCTYDFDNTPIYIPKFHMKDSYHVYGCFCSPECAVAHLMSENIDTSMKFERYHLLNHIYSKIYDYNKNIKPAPDPHYMLERFYGNMTIQEYRSLLKSERLFLVVDKPLTRVLPELHEDNDEFIINNKIIPSSNQIQIKKKILRKPVNKSEILQEHFGMSV